MTQPIKLLIITSQGDTLNSIRPEAESFVGMQQLGVDVTVMTQGNSVYVERMKSVGIKVIDYVPRHKLSWSSVRFIRDQLKQGGYDAAYAFNNKAICNLNFAAIGLPVKVIAYRGQTDNAHRFDPAVYLTLLHPRLDHIICVAKAVELSLAKHVWKKNHLSTIYKGHDLAWYDDTPADLTEFGIPEDAFVVGCVANNRPRKGLPVLLEATHALRQCPSLHLLLIGGGLDNADVLTAIKQSPMASRIHVAGFRTDAPALIASCHVSVLPSIKREGLPKTVIEAMAYGVTPVVTDTGGNAELVEHDHSGLVVPTRDAKALADAIQTLYYEPRRNVQLGEAARRRIETHFHVDQTAQQTKALLERLLAA